MTKNTALDASIDSYDPELSARIYCTPEQQALRFGMALLLATYACFLPGLLPSPNWLFIAMPAAYALAQAALGYQEEHHGPSHRISALISGLDILIIAPALWFDPLASTPTLLLIGLIFGLASLRHRPQALAKLTLGLLTVAALTLTGRALSHPDIALLPLLASSGVLLLLMGLVMIFRHHSIDLRATADLAPHDDPETGLATRTSLYAAARLLWPLAHRQNMPVSLLYVVIEPDSDVSEDMAVIRQSRTLAQTMATVAKSQLRGSDILVRYDRLRFVFILLDCPHANSDAIAKRLQIAFSERLQPTGYSAQAHISATWLPTLPLALDPLLSTLHSALNRARMRGQAHAGATYT
ncbi:MAG: diguanylate cyclase, partial [Paraperlucidibaca sp.]